jgi:HAD superfamily hydrolase (TIGR01549 family)
MNHCYRRIIESPKGSLNDATKGWVSIFGVIFDMDGTLTKPILNFSEMRRRAGVPDSQDILGYVNSLPDDAKARALHAIEEVEEEANNNMVIQPHVLKILDSLAGNQVKTALLTRNSRCSVDAFLKKLCSSFDATLYQNLSTDSLFSHILTRDFKPHKPSPAPVQHICTQWKLSPENVLLVGDGKEDIISGHLAGTLTCLLINEPQEGVSTFQPTIDTPCDLTIASLIELFDILQNPITIKKD